MSQVSIIDIEGNHPTIPTQFNANVSFAIPIANILEILSVVTVAGSTPTQTVGSGNTITIQIQRSQAIAVTDSTKIGLSAFDSSAFAVDANGFVTLTGGGGATTNIMVDASTLPGTNPVVPNAGVITITGAQVAAGTVGANVIRTASLAANKFTIQIQQAAGNATADSSKNGVSHFNNTEFTVDGTGFVSLIGGTLAIDSIGTQTGTNPIVPTVAGLVTINGAVVAAGTNPVRSDGTAANTIAIEVQISQAIAATDATKIGLSNFDSSKFTVDANGFVSTSGTGIPNTITGQSGGALSPTSGNWNIFGASTAAGTSPVTTSGAVSTLTVNVQKSQAIAATDATKVGLATFDSAAFDVDVNGFVQLNGGGIAATTFDVQANTGPGTDPVVPSATGAIVVNGAAVANHSVVLETRSRAANAYNVEVQYAAAAAATDATKSGVAHFNSTQFSVDANGFVALAGGGLAIDSVGTQTGTNPIVPTAAGLITINGAVVAAGTNPIRSDGTGANTLAIEVQISQALAATDATKIGLANFDSAAFDVDANGFVQLNGGGIASTSFDVQANTAPGTDPVLPTAAGSVIVNGAVVANHSVVLETRSRALNTYNLEIQYATSAAATDGTKSGVAHFNSTQFSVDASGFVALTGGGLAIDSIKPNSGTDPVVPDANGLVSILGVGSITVVGSLNTESIQLTGLTNHAIQIGAGTTTLTQLGPTATALQVLQSGGAAADPVFSTATYPATTTVSQILYSSSTNVIGGITTANNSILSTNGSGVPSFGTSLTNDYTFTSTTAGGTRVLTVSNTDNTNTATTAKLQLTTGGASAGDPFITYTVTGATSWSQGIDNSDSDAWVLAASTALGTTNVMRAQTSGEITYPLQSAFNAKAAAQLNVTGDNTNYTVQFTTEIFDQNNDFDGTSTFTSPVTGRYFLSTYVTVGGILSTMTTSDASIFTSNRGYQINQGGPSKIFDANTNWGTGITVLADMDAADTAIVQWRFYNGTKVADINTNSFFFGYLAC